MSGLQIRVIMLGVALLTVVIGHYRHNQVIVLIAAVLAIFWLARIAIVADRSGGFGRR